MVSGLEFTAEIMCEVETVNRRLWLFEPFHKNDLDVYTQYTHNYTWEEVEDMDDPVSDLSD